MTIDDKSLSELIELGERAKREGVRLISDERDFEIMSARLAIPLALEVRRLREILREILASGTENMTKNYRLVQIDHKIWSDTEEALRAQ